VPEVVELIKELKGTLPIMGISLGHLLVALAYGAKCERQQNGNRSVSRPIRNTITNRIETTGMSLEYTIEPQSLEGTGLEVSHIGVLDNMVAGVESRKDKLFSVQYHPEGAPGANDSTYLFDKFIKLMEGNSNA
jgi:carbamoyl-phosphate synthase small subunit